MARSKELTRVIGGSDIGAICGVDERRDAFSVWAEKHGEYTPPPPTARMRLGKMFERALVDYYSILTGREVNFLDATQRSERYPFMAFTPDAVCVHERRGVDAKLVSWDQSERWGDTAADIPAYVQLQALWYLIGLDYEAWDVLAVVGSDAEPRLYTIGRDPKLEEAVLYFAEEFYRRYLVGDEVPPIGATEASGTFLRQRFPRHRAPLRRAFDHEVRLLEEYASIRCEEKDLLREKGKLENALKLACGDGEGLTWERGLFTWRSTRDSTATDWERLAGSLMRGYNEDERRALIEEFSKVRPGVRRIHFVSRGED